MKTVEKIKYDLKEGLFSSLNYINYKKNPNTKYYNSIFPETSYRLAALLEESLLEVIEWNTSYWIDDIILTRIEFNTSKSKSFIWGVVIFGNDKDDKEWVAPLYSIVSELNVEFYYDDKNINQLITYEKFNLNRDIFDHDYYSNKEWNHKERAWKYQTSL